MPCGLCCFACSASATEPIGKLPQPAFDRGQRLTSRRQHVQGSLLTYFDFDFSILILIFKFDLQFASVIVVYHHKLAVL